MYDSIYFNLTNQTMKEQQEMKISTFIVIKQFTPIHTFVGRTLFFSFSQPTLVYG